MQRRLRLTKTTQFEAVHRWGKSWASPLLVLRALPNALGQNRYGFLVSKRVGKAVIRNRIKRRIREAVRLTPLKQGWDMVFIARSPAALADYPHLKDEVQKLLLRAEVWDREGRKGEVEEIEKEGDS